MHKVLRVIVLLTLMLFINIVGKAQGNLLLVPRRVIFEGAKRTQEINLANTGRDTATYQVSFVEMKMNEDGTFTTITTPDSEQHFASGNVRFFPHSVTLGPNEAQVVKVQLVKTNELSAGEYRSHLYFRSIPDTKQTGSENHNDSTNIAVKLIPVYGISIPVIIRVGETSVDAGVSDISLTMDNNVPKLNMSVTRKGNRSVYGDITVKYVSDNGKEIQVGLVKGLAVYTPNSMRHFQLELENKENINWHKGKLHIKFATDSKTTKIVESDLVLN